MSGQLNELLQAVFPEQYMVQRCALCLLVTVICFQS